MGRKGQMGGKKWKKREDRSRPQNYKWRRPFTKSFTACKKISCTAILQGGFLEKETMGVENVPFSLYRLGVGRSLR